MKANTWVLLFLLVASFSITTGQTRVNSLSPAPISPLTNNDIILMVKRGMTAGQINAQILTSACNFDIFPPVLKDLRRRGVPDTVIMMMARVPNGPPSLPNVNSEPAAPLTEKVKLPKGLGILVESLYPVSSADVKEGARITFVVARPVYIDGVLTIARGTVAKAKVIRVIKAESWGRPGALTWEMEEITAVDGTKIPVQLSVSTEGDARGMELAAGLGATAAVLFPYTAPAAIVWGLKKGDEAVLRGSKQFSAILRSDAEVVGIVPGPEKVIYHYAEGLKTKMSTTTTPTAFPRLGVRN